MKLRKTVFYFISVIVLLSMTVGVALADDSIIFRKNISKTPLGETEYASMSFMPFTIPAQAADGTLLDVIEYQLEDESIAYDTTTAKPLIASYIDEVHVEETILEGFGILGGLSIGEHDAFVAHSLDDGATWKTTNISDSADLSSFNLANGHAYPGDVYGIVQSTAGNRVLVAWLSRYCDGGSPLYTLAGDPEDLEDVAYKTYLQDTYAIPDLAVTDIWGVTGTQKSVDYTLQGFPEVGELPYGCVWTARGTLVLDEVTGTFDMAWTKPERLTSGVRDPNRLEVDGVKGAGFTITWQEDPEGLRPGQGLGPGEGWSGAIVNAKTDIWYSYVGWDDFGLVDEDGDLTTYSLEDTLPVEEYVATYPDGQQPKPAVPMAMPVRLTDNNMCKAVDKLDTTGDNYCYADFDFVTGEIVEGSGVNAAADFCAASQEWVTPGGSTQNLCMAPDGRVFNGRVGSSRARITLQPYTKPDGTTGAWFLMSYEETKALGDILYDEVDPIEIGKNIWYHTFDMFQPEVVQQGGILNQPVSFNPETGETAATGEFLTLLDEFEYTVYQTEIARRVSYMAQPVAKIGETRVSAYLLYKQGILNQGGPADILTRRIVVPPADDPLTTDVVEGLFDPTVDNPYLYEYMACDQWELGPDENPNYLLGLCGSPATNLSGTTTDICYTTASVLGGEPSQDCVDDFPWDGDVEDQFPKVAEWHQTVDNLDDQTWENPFDVGKGHRGYIDGDFIMILYAWSPNWKSNSVGNDKYNLYVRRSFDGGQTWTTTPAELDGTGIDGHDPANPWCENYGIGGQDVTTVCYDFAAGEFEPARNVSQLIGTKITILDPRYTPAGGIKKWVVAPYVDEYLDTTANLIEDYDLTRDPSKFFIVYETGDNTTAAEGEPTPMDLFYSRATVYGDVYEWEYIEPNSGTAEYRWPWLEKNQDDLSGEAALTANPSGDFLYADWSQWREDEYENIFDSDIWFRRLFYNLWVEVTPTTVFLAPPLPMLDTDEDVDLYVAAKDNDRLGEGADIVEFEWSVDGVIAPDQTTNHYNAPPRTLSNGWHGFSVRAKDNDGKWSKPVSINLLIVNEIFKTNLPLVIR